MLPQAGVLTCLFCAVRKALYIDRIRSDQDSFLLDAEGTQVGGGRHDIALAVVNESPLEGLNSTEVSSRVLRIALGPKQKRNAATVCPALRLPHRRIVVASAQN